jgi:hypothetical protein
MQSCKGLFWQFGHSVGHSQPQRIPGGLAYVQSIRQCRTSLFRYSDATGYAPLVANSPTTSSGTSLGWPISLLLKLIIMLNADLIPGQEYAFREKRIVGSPLHRVKLLEHVRGRKWKARWIKPNPNLIDYLSTEQVMVPWKDQAAFLKEERDRESMRRHNLKLGFSASSPISEAVDSVISSVGDDVRFNDGNLSGTRDQFERLKGRAGLENLQLDEIPPRYLDRQGRLHLPFETALELARAFCMTEPGTPLTNVEATERNWSLTATRPNGEYIIPLLNHHRASWALIRQWCGQDAAIATRENRIAELERLVWDAVYVLQKAGLDGEANKLRRTIS